MFNLVITSPFLILERWNAMNLDKKKGEGQVCVLLNTPISGFFIITVGHDIFARIDVKSILLSINFFIRVHLIFGIFFKIAKFTKIRCAQKYHVLLIFQYSSVMHWSVGALSYYYIVFYLKSLFFLRFSPHPESRLWHLISTGEKVGLFLRRHRVHSVYLTELWIWSLCNESYFVVFWGVPVSQVNLRRWQWC